jgi:tetratricopeptide (TPR) repeat protein
MNNLGNAYSADGQQEKALPLLEQTLAKRKEKQAPDHPDTLLSMGNLALAYQAAGQLEKALPLLEQTLAKQKEKLPLDHPHTLTTMNYLALAYQAAGQTQKAETLSRDVLQRTRQKYGDASPWTASALAVLGHNLLLQKRYPESEKVLRECLTVRQKKIPGHWQTCNAKSLLGAALLGQKKYAEAEPLLLDGYQGMRQQESKIPEFAKVRLIEALEWLVQLDEATGNTTRAAQWRKALEQARKTAKQTSAKGR